MKLKDLQKEFERAKKNLTKIEKLIDELENEYDEDNELEISNLYKDAKDIENEIEIYQYLAYKYFEEVLK